MKTTFVKYLSIVFLYGLFTSSFALGQSNPRLLLSFEKDEHPISTVKKNARTSYVLTNKNVYQIGAKQVKKVYASTRPIYCGFSNDSSLWLGTDNEVMIVHLKNNTTSYATIDPKIKSCKIVSIIHSNNDSLYIATDAYGLYKRTAAGLYEKINTIFPINTGTSTPDSSLWIGTDAGLFRKKEDEWIRYNEEGVANFEIPDNIVQKLLVDEFGQLWIFMRDGVSVIETHAEDHHGQHKNEHQEAEHDHLPSVAFLGAKENVISDLCYIDKKGYLFASEMGTLWMPISDEKELIENFHHDHSEKVGNKELLVKLNTETLTATATDNILFFIKRSKNIIGIGQHGVYNIPYKAIYTQIK